MSVTVVRSQSEFDAAVAAGSPQIRIESPRGVWVEVSSPREVDVSAYGSASVSAYGSASVRASGSASVIAYGSASVRASGWASVRASDLASVIASGWASVRASDLASVIASGSASVRASGSASVSASDLASVIASGSASVSASGSASVRASGSASVIAYGSASVRASGGSSISLRDRSAVTATAGVAVHLHSGNATYDGGVLIDHTQVDLDDVPTWLDWNGIAVTDGVATLYKAVDQEMYAGHGYTLTKYAIGVTVTAPDWDPRAHCGHGLHATGDPGRSESYYNGETRVRYLELAVPVDGLVLLGDKAKFRSCTVVREVNVVGKQVEP